MGTDSHYTEFLKSGKNSSRTIPYESGHSYTRQLSPRVITCFYKMRVSSSLASIGNLVVNLKEDYLYDLIKDMEVEYNTKIIIVDKNNNVVMDPSDRKNDGKKYVTDITGNIQSNNNNWFNKEIDKKNNLVTFYKFTNADWYLVGLTPTNNMTKTASAIRLQILIIGIISIALIFFFSTFITRDITKGLNELIRRMDKVKNGVLAVESLPSRKDEVGLLGGRFLDMLESFRDSIKDIKDMSEITSKAADEISDNAIKNFEEFENLTYKITDIQNMSRHQNEDINGINEINNELSNKIESIINYFKNIDHSIMDTKLLTSKGNDSVELLKVKSDQVANITLNILSTSEELKNEFKEIEKITETVKVVAKQTDLLALNAEIGAINNTRERINEVMSILNMSSQENVSISREIAASAEEKVHLNKELVVLSDSLKELAIKVENKVQKFKF